MTNPMTEIFAARDALTIEQAREIVAPYRAERQRLIASHGVDNGRKNFYGRTILDHGEYAVCCGPVNAALDRLEAEFMASPIAIAALGMVEYAEQTEHAAESADAIAMHQDIAYGDR